MFISPDMDGYSATSQQPRYVSTNLVKGEVLTPGLEPTTPGSPEESLATRLFPPEEGKSMEPHT